MRIHRSGGQSGRPYNYHDNCNNCHHHYIDIHHPRRRRRITKTKVADDEIQMQRMVKYGVSSLTAFIGIKFQAELISANPSSTTTTNNSSNNNPFETHPWFMYISILSTLVFLFFNPCRYPSMKFKILRKISGSLALSILASLCLPANTKPFSSSSSSSSSNWLLYLINIIIFTCTLLVTMQYSYDHRQWLMTLVNHTWLHGSMILITSLLQRLHVINKLSSSSTTQNSQLESSSSTDHQPPPPTTTTESNGNDDSSPV